MDVLCLTSHGNTLYIILHRDGHVKADQPRNPRQSNQDRQHSNRVLVTPYKPRHISLHYACWPGSVIGPNSNQLRADNPIHQSDFDIFKVVEQCNVLLSKQWRILYNPCLKDVHKMFHCLETNSIKISKCYIYSRQYVLNLINIEFHILWMNLILLATFDDEVELLSSSHKYKAYKMFYKVAPIIFPTSAVFPNCILHLFQIRLNIILHKRIHCSPYTDNGSLDHSRTRIKRIHHYDYSI